MCSKYHMLELLYCRISWNEMKLWNILYLNLKIWNFVVNWGGLLSCYNWWKYGTILCSGKEMVNNLKSLNNMYKILDIFIIHNSPKESHFWENDKKFAKRLEVSKEFFLYFRPRIVLPIQKCLINCGFKKI